MRKQFSADIAQRVVGLTPVSQTREGFWRHREVLAYLRRQSPEQESWVAVDDDADHYARGAPVLLLDPSTGLDNQATEELMRRLAG